MNLKTKSNINNQVMFATVKLLAIILPLGLTIIELISESSSDGDRTWIKWPWIIGGLTYFIFWIISIVNAVRINEELGDGAILIIFAIIPIIIAEAIVVGSYRKKHLGITGLGKVETKSEKEDKLKKALLDGVITAEEFEKKLKELNEK